eukprot:653355-Prymnesium_polylepis.1
MDAGVGEQDGIADVGCRVGIDKGGVRRLVPPDGEVGRVGPREVTEIGERLRRPQNRDELEEGLSGARVVVDRVTIHIEK